MDQVKTQKRRYYTAEHWQEVMDHWKASDLSKSAYCREHDITLSVFTRWQKSLENVSAKENTKQDKKRFDRFIPVTFSAGGLGASRVDVLTAQGHHLWIQGQAEHLALLLKPFLGA
jgi:hypothetical protein